MIKININPLSVNEAWQGRRFKTDKYKQYERDLLFLLPKITIPAKPYRIEFEVGFSNTLSDIDNILKPTIDVMQKKYGINDKDIYRIVINKLIVKKGSEYFKFKIETL